MNRTASSLLKRARQLERLVDDDLGRRLRLVQELVDRPAGGSADRARSSARCASARPPRRSSDRSRSTVAGDAVGQRRRRTRGSSSRQRLVRRRPVRPERLPHLGHRTPCRPPTGRASAPRPRARDGATPLGARCGRAPLRAAPSLARPVSLEHRGTASPSRRRPAPLPAPCCRRRRRPLHRLLLGERRQHAERHRHAGRRRRLHDARATPPSAMYSKCIVSPLIRQPRQMTASKRPVSASAQRGDRNLERAGHAHERDVLVARPPPPSSASRAPCSRPVGDLLVEARDDDREAAARRVTHPRSSRTIPSRPTSPCPRYSPLNSGLRFSRNARVPSRMSCGGRDEAEQRRLEELRLVERTARGRGSRPR